MSDTAILSRYLHRRCVSFDIDKLLSTFDPFHRVLVLRALPGA